MINIIDLTKTKNIKTGSLFNHLMAESKQPVPDIGMGATILMYTDRVAATIVDVSKNGKRVTVQKDKAIRIDNNGMCENQEYRYERREDGAKIIFSKRKDGSWKNSESGNYLLIGERDAYHDYSF